MLKTRIITSVVSLIVVAVVLFLVPTAVTELIIGILLLAGGWEWSGFLKQQSTAARALYTVLVGLGLMFVWVEPVALTHAVLTSSVVFWFAAFLFSLRFPSPIPSAVRWLAGLFVLLPMYAALLELFRLGVEYLIFTLLIVWVADAGAYFAGKQFGRVKLAPSISPGKTWEGVIGGLILVSVLALAVGTWQDLGLGTFVPFCLAVAGLSVVGDLTVSMFKRTSGLKDSGSLFPGHGGVLDRIDSVAAAAPLFALGLDWFGLV